MKLLTTMICASALFAFTACGADSSEQGGGGANDAAANGADGAPTLAMLVWPESGSTVFADTAMFVGDPTKVGRVDGTIAVLIDGQSVATGGALPDSAITFTAGEVSGYLTLPTGKQTLLVQLFDAEGKATSNHQQVEYNVEATPSDLGVQWLEPASGATVKSPFKVRFGLTGAGMSPAGQNALDKTLGHHHISVNKGVVTPGFALPMGTGDYLHYGKAQTEAEVTLEPGSYKLTMQFADAAHRSYGKALAKTIKVTVE